MFGPKPRTVNSCHFLSNWLITFIPGTVYKQNAGMLEKLPKKTSNLFDHHLHEIFGLHSGTDYWTGPNLPNTSCAHTSLDSREPSGHAINLLIDVLNLSLDIRSSYRSASRICSWCRGHLCPRPGQSCFRAFPFVLATGQSICSWRLYLRLLSSRTLPATAAYRSSSPLIIHDRMTLGGPGGTAAAHFFIPMNVLFAMDRCSVTNLIGWQAFVWDA